MLNFKNFGMSGNFFLMFIVSWNVFGSEKNEDSTNIGCVIKEKIYIGMQEREFLKSMEENGWHIVPKTRLFAAKKIEGKEYSFEFFVISKEKPDSILMLIQLICKRNIRVLNNYCCFCDGCNMNVFTNKNISSILKKDCKKVIEANVDKGKEKLDSLVVENDSRVPKSL